MKIKLYILLFFLWMKTFVNAQQLDQYSLYPENPGIHNPAAIGLSGVKKVNLNFRQQWLGFDGAPRTIALTGDIPFKKKKRIVKPSLRISHFSKPKTRKKAKPYSALGVTGIYDVYGPHKNVNGSIIYAYHLPINSQYHISFGLAGVFSQLTFDPTNLNLYTDRDDILIGLLQQRSTLNHFNANTGIWLYEEFFAFGYSANNLINNSLYKGAISSDAITQTHHRVHLSYQFMINKHISITPASIVKYVRNAPLSYEISALITYGNFFWGGLSYRSKDALILQLGFHAQQFRIAYAYDYITSEIGNFSSGSHEISLSWAFIK